MKKMFAALFMLGMVMTAYAQPGQQELPGQRSEYALRHLQYPRVLPDNRVMFKINAPSAQSVQVDLGKKYEMTRDEKGDWTCTTEPQGPGFHYYFLFIDGVRVGDPSTEGFYGCSATASGIEIPYPEGVDQYYILPLFASLSFSKYALWKPVALNLLNSIWQCCSRVSPSNLVDIFVLSSL